MKNIHCLSNKVISGGGGDKRSFSGVIRRFAAVGSDKVAEIANTGHSLEGRAGVMC